MIYKLVVISDLHHGADNLVRIIPLINSSDYIIFCGDGLSDLLLFRDEIMVPMVCVKGNNDRGTTMAEMASVVMGESRVFVTHGHRQNVRQGLGGLLNAAKLKCCQIVFFGHTHAYCDYIYDGVHFVNPGALCDGSYALVVCDGHNVTSKHCTIPQY